MLSTKKPKTESELMENTRNSNKEEEEQAIFSLNSDTQINGPRLGRLCNKIDTPNFFMLASHSGSPQNMTPDLLDKFRHEFGTVALQTAWGEIFDCLEFIRGTVKAQQRQGYFDNLGLNKQSDLVYIATRTLLEDNTKGSISDKFMQVCTRGGNRKLQVNEFVDNLEVLDCDIFQIPNIECNTDSSSKRQTRGVSIATDWLRAIVQICHQKKLNVGKLLGVIQGGNHQNARRKSMEDALAIPDLGGYVLAGFGYTESAQEREQLAAAVLPSLPNEKLRVIEDIVDPCEMLDFVSRGIDVFSTSFVDRCSNQKLAVTFSMASPFSEPFFRDFSESQYLQDTSPICPGCKCYACTTHTRAYINHLLNTKEILANILFALHNSFHFLTFFNTVRSHIKVGSFNQFKNDFQHAYSKVDLTFLAKKPEQ